MNKLAQAFISGFKAAAQAEIPAYHKPGITSSLPELLIPNLMPRLARNESIYDALLRRDTDAAKIGIAGNTIANGTGLASNVLGYFAADPNSLVSKALRPVLGGAPAAANAESYTALRGLAGQGLTRFK